MSEQREAPEDRMPGWEDRAIKEEHVSLIAWLWHVCVPMYDPEITAAMAAETWAMFRADAKTGRHEVAVMKHLSNELFKCYIQLN